MLGVSAWHLRGATAPRCSAGRPGWPWSCSIPATLFNLMVGSHLGVVETTYQPMKIAAAEASWNTCQPCSFSLFQIGGGNKDQTPTKIIQVPHLLSLLVDRLVERHRSSGSTNCRPQYEQQYGPGNYMPNVFIQYWSMRVMAYGGALVFLFSLVGGFCCWRGKLAAAAPVPAPGGVDRAAAVHHEHRRLAAHRERAPAVDRAGPAADPRRCLALGRHRHHRHQHHRLLLLYGALAVVDAVLMTHYARKQLAPARAGGPRSRPPSWSSSPTEDSHGHVLVHRHRRPVDGIPGPRGLRLRRRRAARRRRPDEAGRRAVLHTIAPVWDGNEVWLIVAGAGMFAAFPGWYATMFSGLYLALVLLLVALILRGVGDRVPRQARRRAVAARWSVALVGVGSGGPAAGRGGAGRLRLRTADRRQAGVRRQLLGSAAALLGRGRGRVRGDDAAARRGRTSRSRSTASCTAAAVPAGPDPRRRSRPRSCVAMVIWTHVVAGGGFLLDLVELAALSWPSRPLLAGLAGPWGWAFVATAVTHRRHGAHHLRRPLPAGDGLHASDPAYDLTVVDTSSSPYALEVMTVVLALFLPAVLAYQAWTYRVLSRLTTTAFSPDSGD